MCKKVTLPLQIRMILMVHFNTCLINYLLSVVSQNQIWSGRHIMGLTPETWTILCGLQISKLSLSITKSSTYIKYVIKFVDAANSIHILSLCGQHNWICVVCKFDHILNKFGRFCDGFSSHTKWTMSPV